MEEKYTKNYSWVREGYLPLPLEWYSIDECLPKILEDDYGDHRSKPVLVYLKSGQQFTAYYSKLESDNLEFSRWILCGRDGYSTDDVTHWRWLPLPPSIQITAQTQYTN